MNHNHLSLLLKWDAFAADVKWFSHRCVTESLCLIKFILFKAPMTCHLHLQVDCLCVSFNTTVILSTRKKKQKTNKQKKHQLIFLSLSVPAKHGLICSIGSNWLLFMSTHSDWLSTGKQRHSYYFTFTCLLIHSTSGLQMLQLSHSRLRKNLQKQAPSISLQHGSPV